MVCVGEDEDSAVGDAIDHAIRKDRYLRAADLGTVIALCVEGSQRGKLKNSLQCVVDRSDEVVAESGAFFLIPDCCLAQICEGSGMFAQP